MCVSIVCLLQTQTKWRDTDSEGLQQSNLPVADKGAERTPLCNGVTPAIRGHQVWRLSIPATKQEKRRKALQEELSWKEELLLIAATWQGRLALHIFVMILAIVVRLFIQQYH